MQEPNRWIVGIYAKQTDRQGMTSQDFHWMPWLRQMVWEQRVAAESASA